jgi:hypothetical protein
MDTWTDTGSGPGWASDGTLPATSRTVTRDQVYAALEALGIAGATHVTIGSSGVTFLRYEPAPTLRHFPITD